MTQQAPVQWYRWQKIFGSVLCRSLRGTLYGLTPRIQGSAPCIHLSGGGYRIRPDRGHFGHSHHRSEAEDAFGTPHRFSRVDQQYIPLRRTVRKQTLFSIQPGGMGFRGASRISRGLTGVSFEPHEEPEPARTPLFYRLSADGLSSYMGACIQKGCTRGPGYGPLSPRRRHGVCLQPHSFRLPAGKEDYPCLLSPAMRINRFGSGLDIRGGRGDGDV
jgi:hypothetical protein